MNIRNFFNPYYIYSLTAISILIPYSWGWSTAFPPLSSEVTWLIIITSIISAIIGYIIQSGKNVIQFNYLKDFKFDKIHFSLYLFIILLFIIDIKYEGYIPLFRPENKNYREYGAPFLDVLLTSMSVFYATFLFHVFISQRKIKYLLLYSGIIFINILLYRRGPLTFIFFASVIIFFQHIKTIKWHLIILIIPLFILFSNLFGYYGLKRSNIKTEYVMNWMGASPTYKQLNIGPNHYLTYLYVASPLANLQHNLNGYKPKITLKNFWLFIGKEIIPDTFSKRLHITDNRPILRIMPTLTAPTMYTFPYLALGWLGIILIFIYMLFVISVNLILNPVKSDYHVTINALLCVTIAFCFFENVLKMIPFILPFLMPLIINTIYRLFPKK